MPRLRPQQRQELHPGDCACCSTPSLLPPGASQTLSELDFTRSAAAAAASGDLERLRRLVAKDAASAVAASRRGAAPASASSSDGFTPLHFAVRAARGNAAAAVSLLLAAGADPNAETTAGRATPLHRSAFAGDAGVTRMLLEAGADASRADADGETAAHKAAGQVGFLFFLLL